MLQQKSGQNLQCRILFLALAYLFSSASASMSTANCSSIEPLLLGCGHRKLLLFELSTGDSSITLKEKEERSSVGKLSQARLGTSASRSKNNSKTRVKALHTDDDDISGSGFISAAALQGLFSDVYIPSGAASGRNAVLGNAAFSESCPPPQQAILSCDNQVAVRNKLITSCTMENSEDVCCGLLHGVRAGRGWGEFQACTCSPKTMCDLEPFVDVHSVFYSCGIVLHGLPGC